MVYRPNSKIYKTIKLLEENIEENLCEAELAKNFLNITSKTHPTKEQIDKFDLLKIKTFHSSKCTIRRMK